MKTLCICKLKICVSKNSTIAALRKILIREHQEKSQLIFFNDSYEPVKSAKTENGNKKQLIQHNWHNHQSQQGTKQESKDFKFEHND